MKTLISIIASVLCLNSVNAQFTENFDQDIVNLTGKCWSYDNVNYTTTVGDVINGTGSAYTNPPTSTSGVRSIITPFLNVSSTSFTISFKYKTSSKIANNATRSIDIVLVDKNGAVISLQTIAMDNSTPTSVLTFNKTFTIATPGVYKLQLNIGGSGDGNSRIILDDLYASASAYYTSFCNPAATAVNNSYSSNTISNVNGNVLTNDNIPADNDTYTAVLVSAPTQGTLVLNANGSFTYTPVTGYTGGTITFSYQVADNGYMPTTSNTATVTINYASMSMLPINILKFEATKTSSLVKLSWTVSENETGDFFVVEKSADGKNFAPAATVQTTGIKGTSDYSFTDESSAGTVYYRLKVVSQDNSLSFSKMVIVKGEEETVEVRLLNNPVSSSLNFSYQSTANVNASVKVFSIAGVQVYESKALPVSGSSNISIPVQRLQSGSYVLVIDSAQGRKAIRFVKN